MDIKHLLRLLNQSRNPNLYPNIISLAGISLTYYPETIFLKKYIFSLYYSIIKIVTKPTSAFLLNNIFSVSQNMPD